MLGKCTFSVQRCEKFVYFFTIILYVEKDLHNLAFRVKIFIVKPYFVQCLRVTSRVFDVRMHETALQSIRQGRGSINTHAYGSTQLVINQYCCGLEQLQLSGRVINNHWIRLSYCRLIVHWQAITYCFSVTSLVPSSWLLVDEFTLAEIQNHSKLSVFNISPNILYLVDITTVSITPNKNSKKVTYIYIYIAHKNCYYGTKQS